MAEQILFEVGEYLNILKKFVGNTKYGSAMQCNDLTTEKILHEAGRSGSVGNWYKQIRTQTPKISNKDYLLQYADKGLYGADCVGAIKGTLFFGNRYGGPGNSPNYNSFKDYTIKTMASKCYDVKTDVTKGDVGEFMWTENFGHCAIISKKGKTDIESAPSCDGLKEVPLNYQPNWAGCGKLPWLDYSKVAKLPESDDKDITIKGGDTVLINSGAVYSGASNGVKVPKKYIGKPMNVNSVREVTGGKSALIIELNSWVPVKYLTKLEGNAVFQINDYVKIKNGAVYGGLSKTRNTVVPKQYCNVRYQISRIAKHCDIEEALIKELNSWVALAYLTKVK